VPVFLFEVPSLALLGVLGALSCRGFFPLRDVFQGVHSCAVSRARATFRPQAFSSSRRFAPPCEFVGLFHPTATSRILCRSGVSPAPWPVGLVALPCPLVVQRASLTGKPAATPCARDFEAFVLGAMRSWRLVFSLPFGRSPLRVSSSFRSCGYDVNPVPRAIRLRRFPRGSRKAPKHLP
jgi:hypothetical protein